MVRARVGARYMCLLLVRWRLVWLLGHPAGGRRCCWGWKHYRFRYVTMWDPFESVQHKTEFKAGDIARVDMQQLWSLAEPPHPLSVLHWPLATERTLVPSAPPTPHRVGGAAAPRVKAARILLSALLRLAVGRLRLTIHVRASLDRVRVE
jgi:hypothetical protein